MEKRPNDTIEMLRAEFANARKTAIVGHLHPDGDCISSCLALYHYLKDNYGYEADVYLFVILSSLRYMMWYIHLIVQI